MCLLLLRGHLCQILGSQWVTFSARHWKTPSLVADLQDGLSYPHKHFSQPKIKAWCLYSLVNWRYDGVYLLRIGHMRPCGFGPALSWVSYLGRSQLTWHEDTRDLCGEDLRLPDWSQWQLASCVGEPRQKWIFSPIKSSDDCRPTQHLEHSLILDLSQNHPKSW